MNLPSHLSPSQISTKVLARRALRFLRRYALFHFVALLILTFIDAKVVHHLEFRDLFQAIIVPSVYTGLALANVLLSALLGGIILLRLRIAKLDPVRRAPAVFRYCALPGTVLTLLVALIYSVIAIHGDPP